jgi:predicted aldo/keto reductase-like oxidoreductase
VGASFGVSSKIIEEAFDRGVNYFYWAWFRRMGMRDGLRKIAKTNREKIFITVTSLVPTGTMVRYCVDRARKALDIDYIDGLQFYLMKNRPVMKNLQLAIALKLKEEGVIRHIGVSSHHRPNFPKFAREAYCEFAHVRYNAKHRGAETDLFPDMPPKDDPDRPGMVAFTATSWAQLIKAKPEQLDGLPLPTAGDCYRFALSHPDIDVCLTGPSSDSQMRHALDAIEKGPMTEDELEWMRKVGDKLNKK